MFLGLSPALPVYLATSASPLPPVAGPLIWLDANQETFADNDPVGQFTDRSGNGNHFTSSGTERPTFKINRINGRPAVQADGVDDGLLLSSLASCTDWTLFFVGKMVSDTGAKNLISIDDYGPDAVYILLEYIGTGHCATPSSNAVGVVASMGLGNNLSYCATGNATTHLLRSSDNAGGTVSADYSKAAAPMRLFRRGDGLYINYEISELLFYNSVLDSTQRSAVWSYFNTRYATAIPATP